MTDLLGPGAFGAARPAAVRPPFTPAPAPGAPDTWVQDCSSPSANDGTEWRAAHFNALLDQLRTPIRRSGVTADNADAAMLARAIRSQRLNLFTAAGSADNVVLTPDPAFLSPADLTSTPVSFYATGANTGFMTVTVSAITGALVYPSGRQMAPGDIAAGQLVQVRYNGTVYVVQNAPEYASLSTGNYLAYGTPGTYALVVPFGIFRMLGTVDAGGGGGGGSNGPGSGGSGGGSGGHAEGWFPVTPGETLTINVGAGGVAGTGAPTNGTGGGGSSIARPAGANGGTQMYALGGGGGVGATNAPQTTFYGLPGSGGISAWVQGFSVPGLGGGFATIIGAGVLSGHGAAPYGGSVTPPSYGTSGPGGHWNGGGGAGGALGNAAGPGAAGRVTLKW